MSKGVKIIMGKPTETAELSMLELTDSGLTVGELAWDPCSPSISGLQLCDVSSYEAAGKTKSVHDTWAVPL